MHTLLFFFSLWPYALVVGVCDVLNIISIFLPTAAAASWGPLWVSGQFLRYVVGRPLVYERWGVCLLARRLFDAVYQSNRKVGRREMGWWLADSVDGADGLYRGLDSTAAGPEVSQDKQAVIFSNKYDCSLDFHDPRLWLVGAYDMFCPPSPAWSDPCWFLSFVQYLEPARQIFDSVCMFVWWSP